MSDLPTRDEAQGILDGSVPEALELELVGALLKAYVAGELTTRWLFIEDLDIEAAFQGAPRAVLTRDEIKVVVAAALGGSIPNN